MTAIEGFVEPGFEALADAFRTGFDRGEEVGAAVAIYIEGRKVVDLWGGVADRRTGRVWTEQTPTVIFSCSKGLMAICAYLLVEEGSLDLEAPIAAYWPEFGQNTKDTITVRCALSHRAGLPAIDRPISRREALAWTPVIEAIEAQRPLWEPNTAHAYHAKTYGWLVGEVIRRISGLSPGTFLRRAITEPLGLRTRIGVPIAEQAEIARTEPPATDDAAHTRSEIEERALTVNGAFPFPEFDGEMTYNAPDIRAAELPGSNGISTARDLARAYAACVGTVDGVRLLHRKSIDDALREQSSGPQVFGHDGPQRWGTGFMLDSRPFRWMLGPRSFGHDGAGGLIAFGDDAFGVGFGYVANQMGGANDERANRLVEALRRALSA